MTDEIKPDRQLTLFGALGPVDMPTPTLSYPDVVKVVYRVHPGAAGLVTHYRLARGRSSPLCGAEGARAVGSDGAPTGDVCGACMAALGKLGRRA
ncbi:MAG TPA: hypothetical protein VMI75_17230 [Polyangiaceae bacterium]|nr:hypothetical protein [Polyangiaceae bacterium]